MPTVTILGGGVAGLSAAHYLKQLHPAVKVVLLEASARVGGWVQSLQLPSGAPIELAPRTLRTAGLAGANTIALANKLGLAESMRPVPNDHPGMQKKMLLIGGQLHTLPSSFRTILQKIPPFTKPLAHYILNDLRAPKVITKDESLYSFVSRRFGPEVAAFVVDPLARGVFAGNARELSINILGKHLLQYEQQHGSVLIGAFKSFFKKKDFQVVYYDELVQKSMKENWAIWTLKGGLENLVKALEKDVLRQGVIIKRNCKVDQLLLNESGDLDIKCGENIFKTNHVISSLPCIQLAQVIGSLDLELKSQLEFIPYATVAVVHLEFEGEDLISEPSFGYLVPSSESSKILGAIFDTCVFPQSNRTIITVMMGGYWFESLFGLDPSKEMLLEIAVNEIRKTLAITADPTSTMVSVLRDCIPQYVVGHSEAVANARSLIKERNISLHLTGNAYDGVGINDTILAAKNVVKNMDL